MSGFRRARSKVGDPRRHGRAWITLCAAFALHVIDEALTDFLSLYNPAVLALRERIPWLPFPTFSFEVWITLLIVAVAGLFAATPLVFRGRWAMIPLSFVFAAVMLANGAGHVAASILSGRVLSGAYSSPLLFAAAAYLWWSVSQRSRPPGGDLGGEAAGKLR